MNRNVSAPKNITRSEPKKSDTGASVDKKKNASDFSSVMKDLKQAVEELKNREAGTGKKDAGIPADNNAAKVADSTSRSRTEMGIKSTENGAAFDGATGFSEQSHGTVESQARAKIEGAPQFQSVNTIVESVWKEWQQLAKTGKSGKWNIQLYTGDDKVTEIMVELLQSGEWRVQITGDEERESDTSDENSRFHAMSQMTADQFSTDLEQKIAAYAQA